MNLKLVSAYLSLGVGLISYFPYYKDIFSGKTKPHAFTWFIFALLSFVGFFAQLSQHGGLGAWVTGLSGIMCLGVFILALFRGTREIESVDTLFFVLALASLVPWWFTKDPTVSVILISIIDALGFVPTIRHGYYHPYEETLSTFILSAIKFGFGILALQVYAISTWFYPVSIIVTAGGFSILLIVRRRILKHRRV